jgi:two-component system, cell cycle sensor histidine kinase and response regulator CckA
MAVEQSSIAPKSEALDQARLALAKLHAEDGQTLRDLWVSLAQIAVEALQVERVGVWTLIDEGRALRCRYLLQRSNQELFQGAILRRRDFPVYFDAMGEKRAIVANDALSTETTQQLREAYLEPLRIASMLDAPIYFEGNLVGIVCHEHVGTPRTWSEAECGFAGAVADNVARLYGEHQRLHTQTALHAYQRHLMELNRMEAVGRMAAGIAHDFRGIVSAALGFAELIRRVPELPPQADQYAQRIVEALERGRKLTQQVMSFGKDDPVSPRVLDPVTVIQNLAKMLDVMIGKSIELELELAPSAGRVLIDSGQLERALLNLVLNARDAMSHGGRLIIALRDTLVEAEAGECATYVEIAVSDTGCGMDPETRDKAFEPFFTTKGDDGTGLGLVIVDQIVSRSGGQISIDSELGSGTTVRMFLPRIASSTEGEGDRE